MITAYISTLEHVDGAWLAAPVMLAAAWGCRVLEIKIRTEAAQRAESQRMRDFDAMAPISQRNYVRLVAADQSRRDVTEPPGRRPQP